MALSFTITDLYSVRYMFWVVREQSTALLVVNIPSIWPLLREWFPLLRTVAASTFRSKSRREHSHKWTPTSRSGTLSQPRSTTRGNNPTVPRSHATISPKGPASHARNDDGESQEHINTVWPDGIIAETTVEIEDGRLDEVEMTGPTDRRDW